PGVIELPGPKLLIVLLPVAVPSPLWLAVGLEVAFSLEAPVLFYGFGFHEQSYRFATSEPWLTLVYAGVGIALSVMRDQRRVASLRLLRTDVDVSTLARRSGLAMAVLDQAGSPLQVLALYVGALRRRHGPSPALDAIDAEISELKRSAVELPAFVPEALRIS